MIIARMKNRLLLSLALLGAAAFAARASAAGSGMPWEEPLQQVLESVQARSPRSLP